MLRRRMPCVGVAIFGIRCSLFPCSIRHIAQLTVPVTYWCVLEFFLQVNDEISRQIYDELDKQLDAQIMAELEKCQDEQSRRMDEELDRQVIAGCDAPWTCSSSLTLQRPPSERESNPMTRYS